MKSFYLVVFLAIIFSPFMQAQTNPPLTVKEAYELIEKRLAQENKRVLAAFDAIIDDKNTPLEVAKEINKDKVAFEKSRDYPDLTNYAFFYGNTVQKKLRTELYWALHAREVERTKLFIEINPRVKLVAANNSTRIEQLRKERRFDEAIALEKQQQPERFQWKSLPPDKLLISGQTWKGNAKFKIDRSTQLGKFVDYADAKLTCRVVKVEGVKIVLNLILSIDGSNPFDEKFTCEAGWEIHQIFNRKYKGTISYGKEFNIYEISSGYSNEPELVIKLQRNFENTLQREILGISMFGRAEFTMSLSK
jgi:hypothetical protein